MLVTAGHTPKLSGATVRRTGRLHPYERTHLGVLPVTSHGRTLLDLVSTTEPEPQYPCRGRRIDFAYPEILFGIEANSVQAHAAKEDIQRNAEKANDLIDWWILSFTHDDINKSPSEVAFRIGEAIARRRLMLAA